VAVFGYQIGKLLRPGTIPLLADGLPMCAICGKRARHRQHAPLLNVPTDLFKFRALLKEVQLQWQKCHPSDENIYRLI